MKLINEQVLKESSDLYKGIFWFVYEDPKQIDKNRNFCFKIPSDTYGNPVTTDLDLDLNAKSGTTYNHKEVWNKYLRKPFGKTYNYFGRGRVEIQNGTAKIFVNGNFVDDEYIDFLKDEFNLYKINGINNVRVIVDDSDHYKCHLDSGWKPTNENYRRK